MKDTRSTTPGIAFILPTSCGDDVEKSPQSRLHKTQRRYQSPDPRTVGWDALGEHLCEKELKIR